MREGFTGMKSDSADFILEHQTHYPITIVLFYDSTLYLDSIMKSLAIKILDVFLFKFEKKFEEKQYQDFSPINRNYD